MADNQDDIYKYQPLWENWYIDMPIGKGSFGSVYKISREDMGHMYTSAVKIISIPSDEQYKEAEASFGGDEASLSGYFEDIVHNIINEINMLYTLKGNSNIVDYEDHKVVKKEDCVGWDILIRMEYVTALKKYIAGHQMSKREIIQLGIDTCSALELCSNRGIIHRDIKDDNIFVNQDGVFKLGDFGISKELSKSGRAASMRGTPLYMAPEVYRGDKYDAAVDIYSLGIVMYRLLNHGRMPFMPPYPETIRFKDSEAALEKRMSDQPLPLPDQAGAALGNVIIKACAYQAGDRFATPTEMKRDLERVLSSLSDASKDELVTMLNTRSNEFPSTNDSAITGQPEQKEKTVSIFGAGLTEPISEPSDKPESKPKTEMENTSIESVQALTELPHRDLNKTESIFASRPEPATPIPDSVDQPSKDEAGSKKSYKSSRTIITATAAIVVIVLILAVAMNRTYKSNQLSSQLVQTSTDTTSAISQNAEAQAQATQAAAESAARKEEKDTEAAIVRAQSITKTANDKAYDINVVGDWIYYRNGSDNYTLYKIRTDGTGRTKLNNDVNSEQNKIVDDWIYYVNQSHNGAIYKIRTDGSDRTRLNNDGSGLDIVTNGWIYYRNFSDKLSLYKIRTDGSERTQINPDKTYFETYIGDWIYYVNASDDWTLYKIRTSGVDRTKLNSDISHLMKIDGDWIYYQNANDNDAIYKIRTDGSERQKAG